MFIRSADFSPKVAKSLLLNDDIFDGFVLDDKIKFILFFASQDFYRSLVSNEKINDKNKDTLFKYLLRMSSRAMIFSAIGTISSQEISEEIIEVRLTLSWLDYLKSKIEQYQPKDSEMKVTISANLEEDDDCFKHKYFSRTRNQIMSVCIKKGSLIGDILDKLKQMKFCKICEIYEIMCTEFGENSKEVIDYLLENQILISEIDFGTTYADNVKQLLYYENYFTNDDFNKVKSVVQMLKMLNKKRNNIDYKFLLKKSIKLNTILQEIVLRNEQFLTATKYKPLENDNLSYENLLNLDDKLLSILRKMNYFEETNEVIMCLESKFDEKYGRYTEIGLSAFLNDLDFSKIISEKLKRIITDLGYGFISYEKYNAFFIRSIKYMEMHGLSLIGKDNYENIAFFEYLERILSFNPFNIKSIEKSFSSTNNNFMFTDRISKQWTGREYSNSFAAGIEMISLKNKDTIMVPIEYIFYNIKSDEVLDINRGTSNGIALGNSIDEAILYALLELYERDTFLTYWYEGNLKVRLIKDLPLNLSIESKRFYYSLQNYDSNFFIFERSPNIFVVWCLMISTNDKNKVFSATGVAASIDIDEAIRKSFEEATIGLTFLRNIPNLSNKIDKVEKYTYEELSTHLTINEYIQYYFASYKRKEEFRKIIKETGDILYKDLPSSTCDSYEKFITLILSIYDDVYFYDMSPSVFNEFGLKCVKVSAVGAKELNFFPVKNLTGKSDYFPLP